MSREETYVHRQIWGYVMKINEVIKCKWKCKSPKIVTITEKLLNTSYSMQAEGHCQ